MAGGEGQGGGGKAEQGGGRARPSRKGRAGRGGAKSRAPDDRRRSSDTLTGPQGTGKRVVLRYHRQVSEGLKRILEGSFGHKKAPGEPRASSAWCLLVRSHVPGHHRATMNNDGAFLGENPLCIPPLEPVRSLPDADESEETPPAVVQLAHTETNLEPHLITLLRSCRIPIIAPNHYRHNPPSLPPKLAYPAPARFRVGRPFWCSRLDPRRWRLCLWRRHNHFLRLRTLDRSRLLRLRPRIPSPTLTLRAPCRYRLAEPNMPAHITGTVISLRLSLHGPTVPLSRYSSTTLAACMDTHCPLIAYYRACCWGRRLPPGRTAAPRVYALVFRGVCGLWRNGEEWRL